jgi:hypothetical protein
MSLRPMHAVASLVVFGLVCIVYAWTPVPVATDPQVRMPGTQPNQVALESPDRCLNCHAGYNSEIEPGFNWKGSMMAQSARDFLYFSCLTVAAQDSIWAVGTPNAVDICERCHFPEGWLEGRSDPPNASAMTQSDYDGVHCDFCHRLYDPFFETTFDGRREGADWLNYWDETNASGTPSQPAANDTYAADMTESQAILNMNGTSFFTSNLPPAGYTESGAGQYFVSSNAAKRASFADAAARHQMLYSRFHKSKYFCNTCHDVSNPVLANLTANPANLLPTELNSAFSYFHVERTFSEFRLSAYGAQGGAAGIGPFAPDVFETSDANNHIRMCQDCHMRDVVGVACNKKGVPIRPNESTEHPNSGMPLHDMTGGNAWVSAVLASAIPGSANYDSVNEGLLNAGPLALTLDLSQGLGVEPVALLAGSERAKQQLRLAASIQNLSYNTASGALSFRVQNQAGHKLISGFPEGRRMFVNIQAFSGGSRVFEVNPYDKAASTLKGLQYPYQPDPTGTVITPEPLGTNEAYLDELVYEMHPESSLTGEQETFHFALATGRHKDNRIPPKGFDVANADARLSVPVYYVDGVDVGADLYTSAEYAGGYDEVSLTIPAGADYVEVNLYYQTTSREYVEFLRDEINGTGNGTLDSPTFHGEAEAYIIQNTADPTSDAFFSQLRAWGDTIWALWTHNRELPGAAPFLMTSAVVGTPPASCTAPTPTLSTATGEQQQVTLTWTDESADPSVAGYKVYYDQAGKAQLVADIGDPTVTMFVDTGLTDGMEYCYKVTSYYDATCESGFSDVLCAIPSNQGQTTDPAGVNAIETGVYTGKWKAKTFSLTIVFNVGDGVTIRAYVVDGAAGQALANATVDLLITGPETLTLTTGPSDASGVAEATWQTKAPGRKHPGTTPGGYTVEAKNVSATGYQWDGIVTSATFTIQ